MQKYDPKEIEQKWAKKWIEEKTFTPDLDKAKNPYYALFMFPYPSAEGLHIGNFFAFTSVDVMAKYKKLKGFDVFEPIGWDAFGIHSENYALKIGETPSKMLERTVKNFRLQMQEAGLSCDWTREVDTTSPEYYKWTQWIFTKLFEKGLAYQKEALVNWCPQCKTVLADEQIEADGECERCKTIVEKRKMKQWFFKITEYAERLLNGLEMMDWSEITKSAQKNWIGRSEGINIDYAIDGLDKKITVYTTRPDTNFGATFIVIAPDSEFAAENIDLFPNKEDSVQYIKESAKKTELERISDGKKKTGVFTGLYAINTLNDKKMPIYLSDFVLASVGTGVVVGVPGHDMRDFEFAQEMEIEIIRVVVGDDGDVSPITEKEQVQEESGKMINSEFLDGLDIYAAKEKIKDYIVEKGWGKRVVNYKLRDWCISRQRYWGPPIPVVYCEKCGTVAVDERELPVMLPDLKEGWEPAGNGKGPLANVGSFMKTKCPKCGGEAQREADVMDNFLDSAWYFFRYISPNAEKDIFDKVLGKKWLPVDLYIGGNEHAVLHLMYTRFVTMFLSDLGLVDFENPFKKFRANGMILKDGKKMSKSKGNVISPEEYGRKIGYDALKTYLLFLGPLNEDRSFSDAGVMGTRHWAERIFNLYSRVEKDFRDDKKDIIKLNQTIKAIEEDMEKQKYNTAISKLMGFTNTLYGAEKISDSTWKKFLIIIAPFLPALAEELWNKSGNDKSIFSQSWPQYDSEFIKEEEIEMVVQVNGKLRGRIRVAHDVTEDEAKETALESEKVKNSIQGKEIRKIIFVAGRLINIVV